MYLSILILPFLGSLISGFLGRKIGVSGSHFITSFLLVISSLLAIIAFYEVGICSSPVTIHLSSWIDSEYLSISWEFLFDSLTVSMLIPVLFVSTLVHIYSISYMSEDPHNQRFFSYLSLFTFFMLVLVAGSNYLIMFIGWEGIGVSSYLLINFWYTRVQANKSAILAFTMNRVGDMSLSIAFFSIFWVFGGLDYSSVFSLSPYINENLISTIGLLLLLAAMGKSAQIGLHGWLPGSMEGPTPVSALIHAATLVTAGVYLLMRSSPLIEYGSTALLVIMWVGSITAFFAASSGLLQNDLKRIIAFSTISQMGYLFMAVGLSQYNVALFHLVNHAFFKALLFLAAGSVIHAMSDQQDIRRLGGLIKFLPFTYTAILIGSLSLMALPWLTGFYSKDLIIELAYAKYQFSGQAAYYLGTLTAIFTAFYSFRLISLVFLTYPNAPKSDYINSHEASISVIIPLFLLSLASIFFGFIFSDSFVGIGTDFFGNSLFIHPNHITLVEAEFSLPLIMKLLPSIGSVFAAVAALYLYHNKSLSIKNHPEIAGQAMIELTDYNGGRKLYTFFNGKYLIDIIYNNYIISAGLKLGYTVAKLLDRGVIEVVGPFGISNFLFNTGKNISKWDTGIVTSYALYIVLGLISILLILFAPVIINIMPYGPDSNIVNYIRLLFIYIPAILFIINPQGIMAR
jgi:NADH-ubiquinone oxidoreductase chain 5